MNKGAKILIIAIPVLVIIIGIVTTLSLPIFTLGPEEFSIYTTTYVSSDFSVDDIRVKYFDPDELSIWFYISGGDGAKDLRFEFICLDGSDDLIYSSTSGTMLVEAVGTTLTNSTSISNGGLVSGVLTWSDVPSGDQAIKAVITLDNIVTDTESFHIELR
ncbi:MAG: hypothetical protein NWF07_08485 [Candidatus Bathyarchaeota archaeon]|nr:hypothetical protein [Candidatus Bathyarchaeota archaeon]